jgi:predicted DNA-binding transcriptional regulator AlpA
MEVGRKRTHEKPWNTSELIGDRAPRNRRITMVDFDALPALISVPKAAQLLGLSRASAYRFAASGDLPTRRLGGRVYVVSSRLASFVNGNGEAA